MTQTQEDRIKKIAYSRHPLRSYRLCPSYLDKMFSRRFSEMEAIKKQLEGLNDIQINKKLDELESA